LIFGNQLEEGTHGEVDQRGGNASVRPRDEKSMAQILTACGKMQLKNNNEEKTYERAWKKGPEKKVKSR
jgi:Spy/CpxP family protein refolding chaperone